MREGGGYQETDAAAAPPTVTGTARAAAAAALLAPDAGPSLQARLDAIALTEPVPVEPRN